jgi:ABC-2 type transport system permease protein
VIARLAAFASNVRAMAYREARAMRHDPAFLAMVTVQPLMMLLLFGFVLSNEPAHVPWAVLDRSQSPPSRRLVAEIQATGYFEPAHAVTSYDEGEALLASGAISLMLVIPSELRREAARGRPEVQLVLDGSDPLTAARLGGYVGELMRRFDPDGAQPALRMTGGAAGMPARREPVALRRRFWFNATLADRDFFLAGLAGMLLTNLCLSSSSLGLVSERENGTYEQTLSLPTSPLEIVLGKLLPYVGISYVVLAIAILGPGLAFGVWPQGSLLGLLVLTLPFVLASLAIGVFVSSVARTIAQAVFLTSFFILPSMVLSGAMFPYQLMPDGVRQVGAILPLRWYQIGLRRLVSREGDLLDIAVPFLALCLIFGTLIGLVVWRMKPRLG